MQDPAPGTDVELVHHSDTGSRPRQSTARAPAAKGRLDPGLLERVKPPGAVEAARLSHAAAGTERRSRRLTRVGSALSARYRPFPLPGYSGAAHVTDPPCSQALFAMCSINSSRAGVSEPKPTAYDSPAP